MRSLIRRVPLAAITMASIVVGMLPVLVIGANSEPAHAAVHTIDVSWPTEGASFSGTQPFQALLTGRDLDQYRFWTEYALGLAEQADW